ncbi:hypothetical protein CR513_27787, partial [Mucuna pruriens]
MKSCCSHSRRWKSISLSFMPSNRFRNMQSSLRNHKLIRGRSASINVMPSSPTSGIIQLENKSITHPLGILEDMLVQDESSTKESTLILGRPFSKIARTKIDMHARTLCMVFGDNMA